MKPGWEVKRLGEVAYVIAGQSPEGIFYNTSGDGMPFYQGKKEFGDRFIGSPKTWTTKTTKLALEGDLLMSVRAPVGPINFATQQCCIGRGLASIRCGKELEKDFLFYVLLSMQDEISGTEGAVFASISKNDIQKIEIPVPPLAEQQRIVAFLDEAFAGIATARANAEKNLQNARALFESHLNAVFTQRGEGWVDRKLSSLCREITVGHVGSMARLYKASGVPFLRSQNVRPFEISMDNVVYIDDEFHLKLSKSRLRPGDLAVVRTGYPGTAAVIPDDLKDANCSDLVIIRTGPHIDPHYLAGYFNSPFGKELVGGKLVGAAQKHFNVTAAKDVLFHLPPVPTQKQFVESIRAFQTETQRLESIYQRKIAALDALKKSLLHEAFSMDN